MNQPLIEIWDSVGLGIIIEYPTGIMISNQTGGTACLHPKIEGIFLPLSNDYSKENLEFKSPEIELINYFIGTKYNGNGAIKGIDYEDVDKINSILFRYGLNEIIEVDVNRLTESHEAWIRIKINKSQKNDVMKGFNKYPLSGILTWSNSD
ncbi:hypothetical protein SAMN05444344_0717 [Tenacibaculum mesophilum]|nr:DUF6210 family protein [Tenacibaculum mesophilum]SHF59946.1 hypothetical protein SAMN05444344_0717 [Tenacibaculum mesophilum]